MSASLHGVLALALGALLAAQSLPPPLCRGRTYAAYDARLDRPGGARARAEVQIAYESLCPKKDCGTGEIFQNPTVGNNAITWVSGLRDGSATRARIVYSVAFLDGLSAQFGPGASFGVLAHEVGHHLTAALSLRKGTGFESSWDEELRADYLAGCALARSGRPPDELENALRALAQVATQSHPSFPLRNKVVRKGYESCVLPGGRTLRDSSFGIGAELRRAGNKQGCWGYWGRGGDDVARVGPIAAPRRRSRSFESEASCEHARKLLAEADRRHAEPCTCE